MPKRRTNNATTPKQAIVITTHAINVCQNPIRGSKAGNTRNSGKVATTYQMCITHDSLFFLVEPVTKGSPAIKAPNLSLRFTSSEIKTISAAVIKYLLIIQIFFWALKYFLNIYIDYYRFQVALKSWFIPTGLLLRFTTFTLNVFI